MKIRELMQSTPVTCRPWERLDGVVHRMWEADLGWLPVVDDEERLVGVVTDRDACMHACSTGQHMGALLVKGCMQHDVVACAPGDDLDDTLGHLGASQIHRLPVVDDESRVVGVFTIGDLARASRDESGPRKRKVLAEKVWKTWSTIHAPRAETDGVVVPAPKRSAATGRAAAQRKTSKPAAGGARKAAKKTTRKAGKKTRAARTRRA